LSKTLLIFAVVQTVVSLRLRLALSRRRRRGYLTSPLITSLALISRPTLIQCAIALMPRPPTMQR